MSPQRKRLSTTAAALAATLFAGACAPAARGPAATPGKQIALPGSSGSSPFSRAVRAGDLLFLSGVLGTRPGEGLAPGGIGPETRQALQNISDTLREAGSSMDDVVKCTVFLAEISDFREMNSVYIEFFSQDPPARSTIAAGGLVLDARVEIECIAAAP